MRNIRLQKHINLLPKMEIKRVSMSSLKQQITWRYQAVYIDKMFSVAGGQLQWKLISQLPTVHYLNVIVPKTRPCTPLSDIQEFDTLGALTT